MNQGKIKAQAGTGLRMWAVCGVTAASLVALSLCMFLAGSPFDWRNPALWGRLWPSVALIACSAAMLAIVAVRFLFAAAAESRPVVDGERARRRVRVEASSPAMLAVLGLAAGAVGIWSVDLLVRSVIRNVVASQVASVAILAAVVCCAMVVRRIPRTERALGAWCALVAGFGAVSWLVLSVGVSAPQVGLQWGMSEGRWIELCIGASVLAGVAGGAAARALVLAAR